jgi:hypothetical protein
MKHLKPNSIVIWTLINLFYYNSYSQKLTTKILESSEWISDITLGDSSSNLVLYNYSKTYFDSATNKCPRFNWNFKYGHLVNINKVKLCQEPPPFWAVYFNQCQYIIKELFNTQMLILYLKNGENESVYSYVIKRVVYLKDDKYIVYLKNNKEIINPNSANPTGTIEYK